MRNLQLPSSCKLGIRVNDSAGTLWDHLSNMNMVTKIHITKQGHRPHFIADWAELRGMRQAEIARELGADKSVVSRWFGGSTPSRDWQEKLAALFHCDREALFRHPSEDWMKKFLQGRSKDEVERIRATLETAFPRKTA